VTSRAALLSLLGITFLVGCSKSSAPPESIALPGFSIELPAGRTMKTSDNSVGGVHAIELPRPSVSDFFSGGEAAQRELEVHWSHNRVPRKMWSSLLLPALMTQMPGLPAEKQVLSDETLSESSWLTMVQSAQGYVGIGVVNCNETLSIYVTYVRFTDLDRQTRAMRDILKSVRCLPGTAPPARPVIATRLPPTLGRIADPVAQIYQSLDGERLALNFEMKDMQSSQVQLRGLLETAAAMRFRVEPAEAEYVELQLPRSLLPRKASLNRVRLRTGGTPIYIGAIYCAEQALTVVGFWESPMPSDRVAGERLSQIGCPGDRSTPSPTFESLVESACSAGDHNACALRTPPAN